MYDFLVVLYHVGADYHSGQWSDGYRLMCLADRYCQQWFDVSPSLDDELNIEQSRIYFAIAEKYQRRL